MQWKLPSSHLQEGQGGVIGRQCDGFRLLGCKGTSRKAKLSMGNTLPTSAEAAAKGNQVKRPGKLTKGVLFHQDNAPAQAAVAMAAVRDCGFELVDHPPYSELASSDYFLFPIMKKHLTASNIGPTMRSYLQLRTLSRIKTRASIALESKRCKNPWKKYVGRRGDCVEK